MGLAERAREGPRQGDGSVQGQGDGIQGGGPLGDGRGGRTGAASAAGRIRRAPSPAARHHPRSRPRAIGWSGIFSFRLPRLGLRPSRGPKPSLAFRSESHEGVSRFRAASLVCLRNSQANDSQAIKRSNCAHKQPRAGVSTSEQCLARLPLLQAARRAQPWRTANAEHAVPSLGRYPASPQLPLGIRHRQTCGPTVRMYEVSDSDMFATDKQAAQLYECTRFLTRICSPPVNMRPNCTNVRGF